MQDSKLAPIEFQFAQLIWDNAPITTGALVKLCAETFEWKRSTTYTVLKRVSEKGLFTTENSVVTVLITRPEYEALQSQQFVEDTFDGSLPAFIAAFTSRNSLSEQEAEEIRRMIDSHRR